MFALQEIITLILTTPIIPIPEGMQEAHYVIYSEVQIIIVRAVRQAIPTAAQIPAAIRVHQAVAAEAVVAVAMPPYENFKLIQKRPTYQGAFSFHASGPRPSVIRQVSHSYSTYSYLNS